jgi:hypothetical protein
MDPSTNCVGLRMTTFRWDNKYEYYKVSMLTLPNYIIILLFASSDGVMSLFMMSIE